jgi:hypothetical protein
MQRLGLLVFENMMGNEVVLQLHFFVYQHRLRQFGNVLRLMHPCDLQPFCQLFAHKQRRVYLALMQFELHLAHKQSS